MVYNKIKGLRLKTIKVTVDGVLKTSKSNRDIGTILQSIYRQYNIQDTDIKDGVVDSNSKTWVEIETRKTKKKISIEIS